MKFTILGLIIAAGAYAQSVPTAIPSEFGSLVPSSVLPPAAALSDATSAADIASNAAGSATTAAPFIPPHFTTNPAQWSSIQASLASNGFSWPSTGYGPGFGPWGPGYGHPGGRGGQGGPKGHHWGGPHGYGPFGSGSWGPGAWSTHSDWHNGPWTAWWGGSACPGSDWPGWTQGSWSTDAPWTSWAGCTAITTATNVVTTTVGGAVTAATQYGVRVADANALTSGSSGGAAPMKIAAVGVALGFAVLGIAVGL